MEELKKWKMVNDCTTIAGLQGAIIACSENSLIPGRTQKFNAEEMAMNCSLFIEGKALINTLTRNYGIRQQALFIKCSLGKL